MREPDGKIVTTHAAATGQLRRGMEHGFVRMKDLDPETRARAMARARALHAASGTLLDVLEAKLPEDFRETVRSYQRVGDWDLTFDTLCAHLVKRRIPLTSADRDLVAETLVLFGPNPSKPFRFLADPVGVLAGLTVIDEDGNRVSPAADFDAENWWPRERAMARWGRVGGHLPGDGVPHKTTFPESWDVEKVNAAVLDVARNPDEVPVNDRHGGWVTRGVRDGVRIEVRLRPDGPITSAYPLSGLDVHRTDAQGRPTRTQW